MIKNESKSAHQQSKDFSKSQYEINLDVLKPKVNRKYNISPSKP